MTAVESLLKQPPGQQLAFVAQPDPEQIAETLIALANAEGGSLVLGIDADGKLGGVYGEEDAADALTAALRLCKPPMATEWSSESVPGGAVVLLRLERSPQLHSMADGRVLVRRGVDNHVVDGEEFDLLLAARPSGEYELQPVAGAQRSDFDEDVIDDYIERRQKRNPRHTVLPKDKLLQQIGALDESLKPTINGILLFGKEPQLFMPHSRAIFVKFADVTAARCGR